MTGSRPPRSSSSGTTAIPYVPFHAAMRGARLLQDERMQDRFETAALLAVREHAPSQRGAVELAGSKQDFFPERATDRG